MTGARPVPPPAANRTAPLVGVLPLLGALLLVGAALLALAPAASAQEVLGQEVLGQDAQAEPTYAVDVPQVMLSGVATTVDVEVVAEDAATAGVALGTGDATVPLSFADGAASVEAAGGVPIRVLVDGEPVPFRTALGGNGEVVTAADVTVLPGWASIVPPLVAIALALVTRQVVPSLLLGVWVGASLVYGLSPLAWWNGLLDALQVYVVEALVPPDGSTGHISIVVFTLMIGGMVGIIARNGGTLAIVDRVTRWASTPKRGQVATGGLGVSIFFDDYANTLIVGNAMRPVTDKLRVSREKLAYLVDSTAAPIATIALVSTWIGFEVGLIEQAIAGIEGIEQTGYGIFLASLPYRFYAVLAVLFVFAVAITGRDFGPMLAAERRARITGEVTDTDSTLAEGGEADELAPKEDVPVRLVNAVLPILVLVGVTLGALFVTGSGDSLADIVGSADAFGALIWGSLLGVLTAAALSVGQRLLTLQETVEAWFAGLKSVLFVLIILTLAWSLGAVTEVLHTAPWLASALGETIPVQLVPALLFVIAGAISFATGTSWGTMGILMPLAVPLTWAVLGANDMAGPDGLPILYAAIGTVLTGAVWGDHCSPISDTTVLSSLASGCDHIDHVRTQLPYALVVGGVSIVLGLLPVGFGLPWWVATAMCIVALGGGLYVVGTPVEEAVAEAEEAEPATVGTG